MAVCRRGEEGKKESGESEEKNSYEIEERS
jgi:hypothetical protein